MAPVDPNFYETNRFVVGILSSYAITVGTLLGLIVYSLYITYNDLPIALRTRHLSFERRNEMIVMGALAVICAGANAYGIIEALVESYNVWSLAIGDALPTNVWTSTAWLPNSKIDTALRLDSWIKSVDWIAELSFALTGRSRDFWYAQQLSFATLIWSVFVAVEGRRRNISFPWAYLLLAHLLGLSAAQSLFAIALVLAPPTRSTTTTVAGSFWNPHWSLLFVPVLTGLVSTALFPYFDDNLAHSVLGAIPAALTFLPSLIMNSELVPTAWGTTHRSVSASHASCAPIFQVSAVLSILFHLTITSAALFFNSPAHATTSQYDLVWSTHDGVKLPITTRLSFALSRLFGAISDNPVVRKVGMDVLLSALVLVVYAGMRNLDVHDMLASISFPGFKVREPHESHPLSAAAAKGLKSASKHVAFLENGADPTSSSPVSPSKRGRRSSSPFKASPSKRDASPAKRGRGRPRKSEVSPSKSTITNTEFAEDEPQDMEYSPPPSQREAEQEHVPEGQGRHGEAEVVEEAESAALAWGLLVFGGLGLGSAGVWGAEVVGR